MGLADSNKKKQKISEDPRNTKWATDEGRPGFKMLMKMGWNPSHAATLTPEGPVHSKRLTSIPVAKEDTIGLGAAPNGPSASSIFSKFGSKGLSFVTASKDGSVQVLKDRNNMTEGGHFAGLLEKLNAASKGNSAAESTPTPPAVSASASPAPEVAPVPKVVTSNPRNASRAKFLRAKAQAKSDPSDMAGILGFSPFPTPSTSTSAATSPAPTPTPASQPEPVVEADASASEAQEKSKKDKKSKKKRKIEDLSEVVEGETESEATPAQGQSLDKQSKKDKKKKKKRKQEEQAAVVSEVAQDSVVEPEVTPVTKEGESKEERRERKRRKKEAKAQKRAAVE